MRRLVEANVRQRVLIFTLATLLLQFFAIQLASCSRKFLTGLLIGTLLARNGMQPAGHSYPMPPVQNHYPPAGHHAPAQQPLFIIIPSAGRKSHKSSHYKHSRMPQIIPLAAPGHPVPYTTLGGPDYRTSEDSLYSRAIARANKYQQSNRYLLGIKSTPTATTTRVTKGENAPQQRRVPSLASGAKRISSLMITSASRNQPSTPIRPTIGSRDGVVDATAIGNINPDELNGIDARTGYGMSIGTTQTMDDVTVTPRTAASMQDLQVDESRIH